jgi:hypothetical protein
MLDEAERDCDRNNAISSTTLGLVRAAWVPLAEDAGGVETW